MDFYAAKIVREDGRVSRLISLFADNDAQAEQAIRSSNHFRAGDTVHLANISKSRPAEFAQYADESGIVEHVEYMFADAGPLDGATLFEVGVRKV